VVPEISEQERQNLQTGCGKHQLVAAGGGEQLPEIVHRALVERGKELQPAHYTKALMECFNIKSKEDLQEKDWGKEEGDLITALKKWKKYGNEYGVRVKTQIAGQNYLTRQFPGETSKKVREEEPDLFQKEEED